MSTVISIENLSKKYRLGVIGHQTLTHDLQSWWARVRGKEDPNALLTTSQKVNITKEINEDFWALTDINIKIQQGTAIGIIGRNGAGKSTLLKILSRVTAPSKGQVKVRGRIASLLEVGTGFHPELTGRENIYLNGAILGMSKGEINTKLEEIVSFSGVARHIDTPVKRYSSGMYVRLAFSVAAHLEPEILVVDEVLAVGDVEFQKKCLGKMNEVARQGRTVIFVSHNMTAIENLCNECILLEGGRVASRGLSRDIVTKYLSTKISASDIPIKDREDRSGTGAIKFQEISVKSNGINERTYVKTGDKVSFQLGYKLSDEQQYECRFSVNIDKNDKNFLILDSYVCKGDFVTIDSSGMFEFVIDELPLTKGTYLISLFLASKTDVLDFIHNVYELEVEDGDFYGSGKQYPDGWAGQTVLVRYSVSQ